MNRGWYFVKCALLGLIAVLAIGLVTYYLWNWLVPTLFNGPEITYFQALGILLLSKILFWGLGGKKYHSHGTMHEASEHPWKSRFNEKFSDMSPEEREAFKKKLKDKWCSWEKSTSGKDSDTSNG